MNDLEVSRIKLLIDGDEGDATLKELQKAAADVNRELRRMKEAGEEGSDAWKELKNLQADLKVEIKEFTSAIDLSDASMKELTAKSRQLNGELKDLKVGSDEWIAKMEEIGKVDARMGEVRQEMARLKQEALENSDAYKELQARQEALNQEMADAVRNIDHNEASMAQLTAKSKLLNDELRELKVGSDEWIAKMKQIDGVDNKIREVGEEMDALRTHTERNVSTMDRLKDGFASTFAALSLENIIEEMVDFGRQSITAAAETSDAFADISKATEMSVEEVEGLAAAIDKIDTRTATKDLHEIAVVAGQLGIAKEDVLGFVESVDKAVVALGDEFTGGAEEVAASIGGLQKLFKETADMRPGDAINSIGSALNSLGAAGAATAPVVADFTARMGQLGDLSPQIGETMGLGAAFQELGLSAEIAAGGLSNILATAATDTATFAQQLGVTEGEMKKLINTNPNQFLLQLAQSLRGLPADEVAKRLADLGIKSDEARKVMMLMKDQTEIVTKYQKLANDEMAKGSSLTQEFDTKNKTAAAQLEKMGKEVKSLSVDVGQALLPVVITAGQGMLVFVNTIRAIPGFVAENKTAIAALVIGLVTFNSTAILAAANTLALSVAKKADAIASGLASAAEAIRARETAAAAVADGTATVASQRLTVQERLAAAQTTISNGLTATKTALTNAWTIAQNGINTALRANPIGAVITVLAILAAGLVTAYEKSETFRGIVNGLWSMLKTGVGIVGDLWDKLSGFLKSALQPLGEKLEPVARLFSGLWDIVKKGVGLYIDLETAILRFAGTVLGGLVERITPVKTALNSLWGIIQQGIQKIKDVGTAVADFLHIDTVVGKARAAASQMGQAFTAAYNKEMAAGRAKDATDDAAHHDKKTAQATTSAGKSAAAAVTANKGANDQKATDNAAHLSKEEQKEQQAAQKAADNRKKANRDALDAIAKANIDAIADEQTRKVAHLKFELEQEKAKIRESEADHKLKLQMMAAADKSYESQKAQIEKEFRDKKEKEDKETADRMEKLKIQLLTDEHERKLAELNFQASKEREEVERSITDEKRKAETLDLINKKLNSDITKANDEHRQSEAKKEQEKQEKKLAGEKQLFEAQYREAVANSELNLSLAKENSTAIYNAKLDRLKAEYEYNKRKLETEAAEEKAKNAALIADTDRRAEANKATDAALKAQLSANDRKYESEKTALHQEHLEKRKADTTAFFDAVSQAMNGDYTAFMKILTDKITNRKKADAEEQKDFLTKSKDQLEMAATVVQGMMTLNKAYLESQLKKIEKEKDSQIKAWETQYKEGKISKEDYDKKITELNADFAEKEKAEKLKAWKREQALQVAMALIHGAMAALKSLATMGWPLGLVGVAAAAVLTGVQVAMIKSQKPPSFAKGGKLSAGYVKNAGILKGGLHGDQPGQAGISMIDRRTGVEIGEAEGDEPFMILSRETRKNNGPIIDMLLNSSLHRNGARIFRDGGVYGDYVGRSPSFRTYRDGGYNDELSSYSSSLVDDVGGSPGDNTSGYADTIPTSDGTGSETSSAAASTAETVAQIEKSQELMNNIEKNTAATAEAVGKMGVFLAGPFLDSVKLQNDNLATSLVTKMDQLIAADKSGNEYLVGSLKGGLDAIISNGGTANGLLGQIAAKDLSVSTFVNVFNHISVVAGDSNLK